MVRKKLGAIIRAEQAITQSTIVTLGLKSNIFDNSGAGSYCDLIDIHKQLVKAEAMDAQYTEILTLIDYKYAERLNALKIDGGLVFSTSQKIIGSAPKTHKLPEEEVRKVGFLILKALGGTVGLVGVLCVLQFFNIAPDGINVPEEILKLYNFLSLLFQTAANVLKSGDMPL